MEDPVPRATFPGVVLTLDFPVTGPLKVITRDALNPGSQGSRVDLVEGKQELM